MHPAPARHDSTLDRFLARPGEDTFRPFYEETAPVVRAICRQFLGDGEDAEEAFQGAYARLVGERTTPGGDPREVMRRHAWREADRLRKQRLRRGRNRAPFAELEHLEAPAGHPARVIARDQLAVHLAEALAALPERERDPIRLHYLGNHSHQEIAAMMNLPRTTVSSRIQSGLRRLEPILARQGYGRGAATMLGSLTISGALLTAGHARPAGEVYTLATAGPGTAGVVTGATLAKAAAGIAAAAVVLVAVQQLRPDAPPPPTPAPRAAVLLAAQAPAVQPAGTPEQEPPIDEPVAPAATPAPAPAAAPPAAETPAVIAYDWQTGRDNYRPPNAKAFFGSEPADGARLAALMQSADRDRLPPEEVLPIVRAGFLASNFEDREVVLSHVGGRWIWGKSPQYPAAVEIMYHATDDRSSAYNAVYYGLSVLRNADMSYAVLRALAEQMVRTGDWNVISRVDWGVNDPARRKELVAVLGDIAAEADEERARRAAESIIALEDGVDAWVRAKSDSLSVEQAEGAADALARLVDELNSGEPERVREALLLLDRICHDQDFLTLELLVALDSAAKATTDARLRAEIVREIGGRWVWTANADPIAVEMMLAHSHDADWSVRYNAVYFGISTVPPKLSTPEVQRRLLELALSTRESNLHHRTLWGLGHQKPPRDLVSGFLADAARQVDGNAFLAASIHLMHEDLLGEPPPADWGLESLASPILGTERHALVVQGPNVGVVDRSVRTPGIRTRVVNNSPDSPPDADKTTILIEGPIPEGWLERLRSNHPDWVTSDLMPLPPAAYLAMMEASSVAGFEPHPLLQRRLRGM
jgi:RNA polymerase sigma-70 factor (ECF subfamily)